MAYYDSFFFFFYERKKNNGYSSGTAILTADNFWFLFRIQLKNKNVIFQKSYKMISFGFD